MKRVSIFLVALALIVGMTGCFTPFPRQYELTISSTEGGSVTYPGEGTFAYNAGDVVNLVAIAEGGYYFIDWGGDVSTIANVTAAPTNITMNGNYYITSNFALEIRDWYDLDVVRNNLAGNHTLMNDLDSTTPGYEELASPTANQGKVWQPIGAFAERFSGTFDGQGYEIRDLFINRPDGGYLGLFSYVGEGGVVEDIGVVNVTVTGFFCIGGLVGENSGTVSNSFWDIETSEQATSDGGTGKTTAEMQHIDTFSGAAWNIIAVANPGTRNPSYTWNIVDDETYPFLSRQP